MFADFFNSLFFVSQKLMESVGVLVEWLKTPLKLGFDIPVIGFIGVNLSSPLSLIAYGMVGLIVFWCIKAIVPFL